MEPKLNAGSSEPYPPATEAEGPAENDTAGLSDEISPEEAQAVVNEIYDADDLQRLRVTVELKNDKGVYGLREDGVDSATGKPYVGFFAHKIGEPYCPAASSAAEAIEFLTRFLENDSLESAPGGEESADA